MIHPNDDNGDVLRRMQSQGDDLTRPRDINFSVVFSSEQEACHFSEELQAHGYEPSVDFAQVEEGFPWDVHVVKHMVPSYTAIVGFEEQLADIAEAFGGKNDGWGCFTYPVPN